MLYQYGNSGRQRVKAVSATIAAIQRRKHDENPNNWKETKDKLHYLTDIDIQ